MPPNQGDDGDSFDYEQYRKLGTPDMRLLRWRGVAGTLDSQFRFDAQPGGRPEAAIQRGA